MHLHCSIKIPNTSSLTVTSTSQNKQGGKSIINSAKVNDRSNRKKGCLRYLVLQTLNCNNFPAKFCCFVIQNCRNKSTKIQRSKWILKETLSSKTTTKKHTSFSSSLFLFFPFSTVEETTDSSVLLFFDCGLSESASGNVRNQFFVITRKHKFNNNSKMDFVLSTTVDRTRHDTEKHKFPKLLQFVSSGGKFTIPGLKVECRMYALNTSCFTKE